MAAARWLGKKELESGDGPGMTRRGVPKAAGYQDGPGKDRDRF
jgi:hypothetical protein